MPDQQIVGGYRPEQTTWTMKLRLPPFKVSDEEVTAVVGFCFRSGEVLSVKNSRGWDIPGAPGAWRNSS